MEITLDSSYMGVNVIQGGVTHNITEVRVVKGGVTSTVWTAKSDVPDVTQNVSINYSVGYDNWAQGGTTTLGTFATNIDTSLYSGAILTLSSACAIPRHAQIPVYMYLTDGSTNSEITYAMVDGNEEINSSRTNLNPTITFSKSSGTVNLSITLYAGGSTVMGDCWVNGGTLTLIGRKG